MYTAVPPKITANSDRFVNRTSAEGERCRGYLRFLRGRGWWQNRMRRSEVSPASEGLEARQRLSTCQRSDVLPNGALAPVLTVVRSKEMAPVDPSQWPLVPRGNTFEDHVVGRTFRHHWGRTVYQSDNIAFSTQMLAFNPTYFNRDHAQREGRNREIINPLLVFCTVFGLSVEDLSEGGGLFLGAKRAMFHRDVYPGETLYATSKVLRSRESGSRPDAGVVTWQTTGHTAAEETVIDFERTNLVRKRGHDGPTVPAPDGFAEDFTVGQRFRHARTRTVTDLDLNGFTLMVMNTADAHFSEQAMAHAPFGGRINFGGLTLSLTVGLATQDTAGQAIRELGMDNVRFAVPVQHGDTIGAGTEVLAVEAHEAGGAVVTFRHYGINQHGAVVCEVDRSVHIRSRAASLDCLASTSAMTSESN